MRLPPLGQGRTIPSRCWSMPPRPRSRARSQDGAPADVFISADEEWMDTLEKERAAQARDARDPAGQHAGADRARRAMRRSSSSPIAPAFFTALGKGPLAIADPDAVPAGKYGKAALLSLRLWEFAGDRLALRRKTSARRWRWSSAARRRSAIVYGSDATGERQGAGGRRPSRRQPSRRSSIRRRCSKASTSGGTASPSSIISTARRTGDLQEARLHRARMKRC